MPYLLGAPFPTPQQAAGSLDGLQWLLPFTGAGTDPGNRACPNEVVDVATMHGVPGATYDVTIALRGIVELKTYAGGTNDGGFWQVGGAPAVDPWNVYRLEISSPAQTYYVNRGTSGLSTVSEIDYSKTIPIDTGATVTLTASSIDDYELSATASASGVTNPPQPYEGQWINMSVTGVTRTS